MAKVTCQNCGAVFEALRKDAKWCPDCKILKRREVWRLSSQRTKYNTCPQCGERKFYKRHLCRACENKRRGKYQKGEGNPNWRGGKTHNNGYIYLRTNRSGKKHCYQAEHIVVWEQANGRLPDGWVIHHLNGVRDDNRLENLAGMPRKQHNPLLITKPYQNRIRQLEAELSKLASTKAI
ncbi:MAG: HNH endonuclease [Dehalococcoidia bacterium]|nr:HNH endonuclease [Dehalococcoidia bacterium]